MHLTLALVTGATRDEQEVPMELEMLKLVALPEPYLLGSHLLLQLETAIKRRDHAKVAATLDTVSLCVNRCYQLVIIFIQLLNIEALDPHSCLLYDACNGSLARLMEFVFVASGNQGLECNPGPLIIEVGNQTG